ncbi:MAG: DEAD/DEAH box helicase [Bacteroidetes bacterium]|nr:MAG: DEAD/DEAH box helicase [Bacteroidota bacterium]
MAAFENFKLNKQLFNGISELDYDRPTPIQEKVFSVVLSGRDVVGIAQTGTGKTLAYMLPILQQLKYSSDANPSVLILVPTRELVLQLVKNITLYTKYISTRIVGVYGGTNIITQQKALLLGTDIVIGTPQRLYDLVLKNAVKLNSIKKLVIDEVDVMLDFGYRTQLINIFDYLPQKRQNIMFSATMTERVDVLIDSFFKSPAKISIAVSGTPLDNIAQECYQVHNLYTKINLLVHLLKDNETYRKVLVFVSNRLSGERLFEELSNAFDREIGIIHSGKEQNFRVRSIKEFDEGVTRVLVATDVIARGIDLEKITTVFNFDTPIYPENYMHRIGRTGRAEQEGSAILFYTEKETKAKEAIESLMAYTIPEQEFPKEVEVNPELTPEEKSKPIVEEIINWKKSRNSQVGAAFHEKSEKNRKTNQRVPYKKQLAAKYKKSLRRGDKIQNMKKKRKR